MYNIEYIYKIYILYFFFYIFYTYIKILQLLYDRIMINISYYIEYFNNSLYSITLEVIKTLHIYYHYYYHHLFFYEIQKCYNKLTTCNT